MTALKVLFGMLVMAALTGGAAQFGLGLGLDDYWAWMFATAVLVGALILIDPANRRG